MAHQLFPIERLGDEVDETLSPDWMEVDGDSVKVLCDLSQWYERRRNVPSISLAVFNSARAFTVRLIDNRHQRLGAGSERSFIRLIDIRHIEMNCRGLRFDVLGSPDHYYRI